MARVIWVVSSIPVYIVDELISKDKTSRKGTCTFCTYVLIKGNQVYIITFELVMTNTGKGALGADHMDTGKAIQGSKK